MRTTAAVVFLCLLSLPATLAQGQRREAVTMEDIRRELEEQRALIEDQRQQIEAQQEQIESIEAGGGGGGDDFAVEELLLASEEDYDDSEDALEIYGFMDVGWQRFFASEDSFFNAVSGSPANSFVLGNFNLFFDVQPAEGWRGFAEVRLTTLPHGVDVAYGLPALGVPYERTNAEVFDSTSATGRNRVILGSVIIERAWIEYAYRDWLKIRTGSFFTPVGIWNIDHGTPTLIALTLPSMIASEFFPLRQLGIQVHGNINAEPWEIGYHLTISNGRIPGQFDLSDNKAFGGRLYFGTTEGDTSFRLGFSGIYNDYLDQEKNIVSFDPFLIGLEDTIKYREYAMGVDLSVDVGGMRWRTEGVARHVEYTEGFREPALGQPGSFAPDRWELNAYTVLAYRFAGLPIEPFTYWEITHRPTNLGDTILGYSIGLNIYFTEQVQLKTQAIRYIFRNVSLPEDPAVSNNDFGFITTRLVLAF